MKMVSLVSASVSAQAKAPHYKWILSLVMVAVLALGWSYPLFGFVVPVAMVAGIAGSFFRGRWVCGNVCPRGSFLDTWFRLVAGKKEIPALLKRGWFRWTTLILLMGFMAFRLAQNPGEADHWGRVFWQMCLLTTLIAVLLGLRYSARSWCSFCPVGTLANRIGGEKFPLQIKAACQGCGACEKHCPMQIDITTYRGTGTLGDRDCLKCSSCLRTCPRGDALGWPERKAA